jgi:hypothetical protein
MWTNLWIECNIELMVLPTGSRSDCHLFTECNIELMVLPTGSRSDCHLWSHFGQWHAFHCSSCDGFARAIGRPKQELQVTNMSLQFESPTVYTIVSGSHLNPYPDHESDPTVHSWSPSFSLNARSTRPHPELCCFLLFVFFAVEPE